MNTLIPKHQNTSPIWGRYSAKQYVTPTTGIQIIDDAVKKTKQQQSLRSLQRRRGAASKIGVASPGAQKQAIMERQRKLKEAGYYTGKIDGIWGKKSKAAQTAYNRDNKQDSNITAGQRYRQLLGRPEPERKFIAPEMPDHTAYRVYQTKNGEIGIPLTNDFNTVYDIQQHSKRNWGYVDKRNGQAYFFKGEHPVHSFKITLGRNLGDGYYDYSADPRNQKYLEEHPGGVEFWKTPAMTPAGAFSVVSRSTSPYVGNEPLYYLTHNGKNIQVAVHSPANTTDRIAPFRNPNVSNRVSYGCISGNCGNLSYLYDNKLLNTGDSLFVSPTEKGNYFKNVNGKPVLVVSDDAPSTFNNGKWSGELQYAN